MNRTPPRQGRSPGGRTSWGPGSWGFLGQKRKLNEGTSTPPSERKIVTGPGRDNRTPGHQATSGEKRFLVRNAGVREKGGAAITPHSRIQKERANDGGTFGEKTMEKWPILRLHKERRTDGLRGGRASTSRIHYEESHNMETHSSGASSN